MTRLVDDGELLAWLTGALAPGARREVEATLAGSPLDLVRAGELRRGLDASDAASAWRVPPPLLARPLGWSSQASALLGDHPQLDVLLPPVDDPSRWWLLVIRSDDDGWQVMFPASADDLITVDQLEQDATSGWRVSLDVGSAPGARWALCVVPTDVLPDWSAEGEARFEPVRVWLDARPPSWFVVEG